MMEGRRQFRFGVEIDYFSIGHAEIKRLRKAGAENALNELKSDMPVRSSYKKLSYR